MSWPRVFTGIVGLKPGDKVTLDGADSRHLVKVLRLSSGDQFELVSEARLYLASLRVADSREAEAEVLVELPKESEPELEVVLVQGLPKGDKMDLIVQKATELGVSAVIPLEVERSVVHYSGDKARKKVERWQKIAREAAKQSGRLKIPQVSQVMGLTELARDVQFWEGLHILAWEGAAKPLKEILRTGAERPKRVVIYIGPEGSFSDSERELILSKGAEAVSLGPRILRTETAGIALTSMIMYEYDQIKVQREE
ncbi:MAG: 16S rRNA (uracil(1498)-N(3))-methyltransferase [Firmicutes bacterium]|nr:16S rRNA (uracil(1498)-N(3))-methyltransferase [Bacillota bacterium]